MSKNKFTLTYGLAHIKVTGEPVYITHFGAGDASVIRPVVTQNGVEYRQDVFPISQLETPLAKVKRELQMQEDVRDLQEKLQEKRYRLSPAKVKALQSINPSHKFNGDGDING